MSHHDLNIRAFHPADEAAVIQLWHDCGLTRPWNDPKKDVARKLTVQPGLFLVGEAGGRIVAATMAGMTGIAAGSTTLQWRRTAAGVAMPRH